MDTIDLTQFKGLPLECGGRIDGTAWVSMGDPLTGPHCQADASEVVSQPLAELAATRDDLAVRTGQLQASRRMLDEAKQERDALKAELETLRKAAATPAQLDEIARLLSEGEHGEALQELRKMHGLVNRFVCPACADVCAFTRGGRCSKCGSEVQARVVVEQPEAAIAPASHTDRIVCPQCKAVQVATVQHTQPFFSYAHECSCGYWITESEWERVEANKEGN